MPKGVREIEVFCVGGGCGGFTSSGGSSYIWYGGGGCSGYTITEKLSVKSGYELQVQIASAGGNTIVGDVIGKAGTGSGGGSGGGVGGIDGVDGHANGSNGASNGGTATLTYVGSFAAPGQGTTTRAFGEPDGTLYAGGGGGYPGGSGGSGGGGNCSYTYTEVTSWTINWDGSRIPASYRTVYVNGGDGAANTGSGGGGGDRYIDSGAYGGAGGSGIAIIRWGY